MLLPLLLSLSHLFFVSPASKSCAKVLALPIITMFADIGNYSNPAENLLLLIITICNACHLKLKTAAVSAVAEVDRPQPGGAGCGRFFPCLVIPPEAALSVERNPQPVGPSKLNRQRKNASSFLAH